MFQRVIALAKPLSTDEIKDKILRSATMQGRRILYERDFGGKQYGICFCADAQPKSISYIHIRIIVPGEFKYEEMIRAQEQHADTLMVALGKEIEA